MAAVAGIVSRHGLRIKAHCRNQYDESKLSLYNPLLLLSFKTVIYRYQHLALKSVILGMVQCTVYVKTFKGENFRGFRGF